MSFAGEPANHFSLKELYRVRRQSLSAMVQDCYDRLLGEPAISILEDSEIIQQHKVQSIERIVQTLIDSEGQLMIAKLSTEVELLQSEVRMLKEKLNHYMVEAESRSERESPEAMRHKVSMLQEQRKQEQEQFKAMLKEYGFEFVNSLQYSLQRVLKEYSFASRGVATREELIDKLYKEMGRDDATSKHSTPTKSYPNASQSSQQLLAQIDRLNGLVRTLSESKDSTCSLLQKKLQDAEHKHTRDVKLLKESESKLRQQLQRIGEVLKDEEQRTTGLEQENIRLKEDGELARMELLQANTNKQQFQERLKQLQQEFEGMRTSTEELQSENKHLMEEMSALRIANEAAAEKLRVASNSIEQEREMAVYHKAQFDRSQTAFQQEMDELRSASRSSIESLTKEGRELRQRLVQTLAELELHRMKPPTKVEAQPLPAQPSHQLVSEMQRVCNERISQYEQELNEKNTQIVQLTKDKLQLLRTMEEMEEKFSQQQRTKQSSRQESAALVDDISIILKTMEFERKLHGHQSQHLRKIAVCESGKLSKEVGQLKQLLSQKQAMLKKQQSRKTEDHRIDKLSLLELRRELTRLSADFRCLQQLVKRQLGSTTQLFQLVSQQQESSEPLHNHNRTKKAEPARIRHQSQSPRTLKLSQQQRYLWHLDRLLDSSSSSQQQ